MKRLFKILRGHFRTLLGFCPKCKSNAPELDTCRVCNGYRTSFRGMPTKPIKRLWMIRYLDDPEIEH